MIQKLLNKDVIEDWVQPAKNLKLKKELKIDWNFIASLEGFEIKGYVPKEEVGKNNRVKSGVTIASGFDLGQHEKEYLTKIGLSDTIKDKLIPYMGIVGENAKQALLAAPLYVTKEEALEINEKVKNDKAREAAELYNRDSKLDFYDLDSPLQTVIMSVAFQYGDPSRRTPNFWKTATSGDWKRMLWHFENFGDKYKRRRLKEAKVLRSYLEKKGLLDNA